MRWMDARKCGHRVMRSWEFLKGRDRNGRLMQTQSLAPHEFVDKTTTHAEIMVRDLCETRIKLSPISCKCQEKYYSGVAIHCCS